MDTIAMSGKEYLLYLRSRQELMMDYILECFKGAEKKSLSEQELLQMVEARFCCELPVDDPENVILKGVLTNMLDRYEVQGKLIPVAMKYGPGYQLIGEDLDDVA